MYLCIYMYIYIYICMLSFTPNPMIRGHQPAQPRVEPGDQDAGDAQPPVEEHHHVPPVRPQGVLRLRPGRLPEGGRRGNLFFFFFTLVQVLEGP